MSAKLIKSNIKLAYKILRSASLLALIAYVFMEYRNSRFDQTLTTSTRPIVTEKERDHAIVAAIYVLAFVAFADSAGFLAELAIDHFSEQQQSPRTISFRGKKLLKDSLSKYSRQRFCVRFRVDSEEGKVFANDLTSALLDCGWKGYAQTDTSKHPFVMSPGIAVWCIDALEGSLADDSEAESVSMAWAALESSLEKAGVKFSNQGTRDGSIPRPEKGAIEIFVGVKPMA